MSNVGALDQIRTFLRANPDLHDQSMWTCGTTACVAGWTVAFDQGLAAGCNLDAEIDWAAARGSVERRAGEILGLSGAERDALFVQTIHRHPRGISAEEDALLLIDALIARDKGDLCDADRAVLRRYGLSEEPAS